MAISERVGTLVGSFSESESKYPAHFTLFTSELLRASIDGRAVANRFLKVEWGSDAVSNVHATYAAGITLDVLLDSPNKSQKKSSKRDSGFPEVDPRILLQNACDVALARAAVRMGIAVWMIRQKTDQIFVEEQVIYASGLLDTAKVPSELRIAAMRCIARIKDSIPEKI